MGITVLTIDTKLRAFQFKINHDILYTNSKLHYMLPAIVTTPLCTLCKNCEETVTHLFYTCHYSQDLWDCIVNEWDRILNLGLSSLTASQVILGDSNLTLLCNFITLLFKKYIYKVKLELKIPIWVEFKAYVRQIHKIEQFLAMQKGKLDKHLKKWGAMNNIL